MARKPVILSSSTEELPIAGEPKPAPVLPRKVTASRPMEDKPKAAAVPVLAEVPEMLEFRPLNEAADWRVEKCDLLATEFGLAEVTASRPMGDKSPVLDLAALPGRVAAFVFFCQTHPRLWLLVRRIYGIAPVILAPDAKPEDVRVWTRAEMAAEGYEVKTDLEALRGFWLNHCQRETSAAQPEVKPVTSHQALEEPDGHLDDKLLEEFDFSEQMFRITVFDSVAKLTADGKGGMVPRLDKENRKERAWFIGRVKEWYKMLKDSIGQPVARAALMNEMTLRRLEAEIAVAEPKTRAALYDQRSSQATEYRSAIEDLQRMFPELAVAGKVSFKATMSDVIVSHLDYYGNGDRRLVDKVHTVTELEYLLRTSSQVEARYRMGLNLAIIENISGLTDPNFRSQFKPRVLKLIDAGFRAGLEAARAATREKVVDLENGVLPGEGDDFEDFNDAECPHCGGRLSSLATRCPECRKQIHREPVIPPASHIPPASAIPPASDIPPASAIPPASDIPPQTDYENQG